MKFDSHYLSRFLCPPNFIVVVAVVSFTFVTGQTDDAYVDKTYGLDVTQSVVRRIIRTHIVEEDHSYLQRIAYTESKFGTDDDTYRPNYFGGIWQLDENMFAATQADSPTLRPLHAQILTQFSINWTSIAWSDLLKPMYSGIGARLFLAQLPNDGEILDTLVSQANHWKMYYRPDGNADDFIRDAQELENSTRCRGKVDLSIVLDGSNSISNPQFIQAKSFVASLIQSFELDFTRLGMVVYSTDVDTIFPVKNSLSLAEMSDLANGARHPQGNTATGLGMLEGIALLIDSDPIEGIPQVMAVLTDGQSNRPPPISDAADEAIANRITTFAVGIGDAIGYNELVEIALNNPQRVFSLAGFDSLADFLFRLTSVTCEIPQRPEANQTYEDNLMQNERRYYEVQLPDEGVSVTVTTTKGSTAGYWSYDEEVPSSALNDGILTTDRPTFIPYQGGRVFIAVEGLEIENEYSFTATEGGTEQSTTTSQPPTTPPGEGEWCDIHDCKHWGSCQDYFICDNTTHKWAKRFCGEDLFWDPSVNPITGGQCVRWEELSLLKQHEYRYENCLACYWKPILDCYAHYRYQPANLTNPQEVIFNCPATLVFDPFDNMCLPCGVARKQNGGICPC